MTMRTLLYTLLLLWTCGLAAQRTELAVERMQRSLMSLERGADYVDTLNEIAYSYRKLHPDSAVWYAGQATALAQEIGYGKGLADSNVRKGVALGHQGAFAEARLYLERAASQRLSLGDYRGVASVYNNLGNHELKTHNGAGEAAYYYQQGIDALSETAVGDASSLGIKLYNGLGFAHLQSGQYDAALQALEHALDLAQSLEARALEASVRLNLGIFYRKLDNYTQAEEQLLESLAVFTDMQAGGYVAKCYNELGNLEFVQQAYPAATDYYEQALATGELGAYEQAVLRENQGGIYEAQGKTDLAIARYQTALEQFRATDNPLQTARVQQNLGLLYLNADAHAKSRDYLAKALEQLQQVQAPELRSNVLFHLAVVYNELGQTDSAMVYSQQNLALIDGIYQNKERARNLDVNLKTAQAAMASLEKEKAVRDNRLLMYFSGAVALGLLSLLLLAVIGLFINRQRMLIAEQREALAYQKVDNALQEAELDNIHARLKGEEKARKQIGKDLHDRIGGMLSVLKLSLAAVEEKVGGMEAANKTQYKKVNALIDETADEVRRISHNMSSFFLTKFGLKVQLEEMAQRLRETGKIEVELSLYGMDERMDSKLEFEIYRIVQELVSNALKHAKASLLTIQLNRFDPIINIIVEDDGVGFKPDLMEQKRGMGLENVRSRAYHLNGAVNIDSSPGKGTTISIDIEQTEPNT